MERTPVRKEKLAVLSMEYFDVSGMAGEQLTTVRKNELKFEVAKAKNINQPLTVYTIDLNAILLEI